MQRSFDTQISAVFSQASMQMNFNNLFRDFTESEKSGGIVLIIVTILSLAIANSPFAETYHHIWSYEIFNGSIEHWINDGLMAFFFLLIGLEMEREVYKGELSTLNKAALPVAGAIGGMILPVVFYILLNYNGAWNGLGIPMATDIAFALGILSLLGNRIPLSLKIFLTALAIIDDLGAILVIAIFYSDGISFMHLSIAMGILCLLFVFNRLKLHNIWLYLIPGAIMWYFMMLSGVHATITGVLVAFAIPFGQGEETSVSYRLQHLLHKPVAFIILPIFALANTALDLTSEGFSMLINNNSLGIAAGLLLGKPLGIVGACYLAVKSGLCTLPSSLKIRHFWGIGFLGGIGFTMSIFISLLAFSDQDIIETSKLSVLITSVVSGTIGFLILRKTFQKRKAHIA